MTVMGIGPLLALAFLAGLVSAAMLLRSGKLRGRRQQMAGVALPFLCLGLPLLVIVVLAAGAGLARWLGH